MDMYRNDYNGGARLIDIANQNIARSQRGYINHNGGASSDHQLRKSFEFLEVSLGKMTESTRTHSQNLYSAHLHYVLIKYIVTCYCSSYM